MKLEENNKDDLPSFKDQLAEQQTMNLAHWQPIDLLGQPWHQSKGGSVVLEDLVDLGIRTSIELKLSANDPSEGELFANFALDTAARLDWSAQLIKHITTKRPRLAQRRIAKTDNTDWSQSDEHNAYRFIWTRRLQHVS